MNDQINYITKLAEQYKVYFEKPKELFTALNQLSQSSLETIYKEYGDSDRDFQPVNLLRAEIARGLLEGNEVTKDLVEKIKQKIRTKDIGFFSHLSEKFLEQIEKHKIGKRDMFANWQVDWRVFHTFFYRGKSKETVQIYLEQICKQLINDLQLEGYTYHWVDFY